MKIGWVVLIFVSQNLEILVFQTWNHRNPAPPAVFRIPMEKDDLQQFCRQRWPNASDSWAKFSSSWYWTQLNLIYIEFISRSYYWLYWLPPTIIIQQVREDKLVNYLPLAIITPSVPLSHHPKLPTANINHYLPSSSFVYFTSKSAIHLCTLLDWMVC